MIQPRPPCHPPSDGTWVAEAIVLLLRSAGLDPLVFLLTLVLMTLKIDVK